MSFESLGLAEPLLRAVAQEGYAQATPIQKLAIGPLVAGRDLLASAQTGTGKTAAFALPLLHRLAASTNHANGGQRRPRALILCPTRELAVQIGESLATYGRHTRLRHAVIFGGVNQFHQVKALRRGVDTIVATPGRLLDLVQQGHIDLSAIEIFVLDEADRMFDMGFLPDLQRVVAELPRQRQTMLFSATMPGPIERLAQSVLRNPERIQIEPEQQTIDLIAQEVRFVGEREKQALLEQLLAEWNSARVIVFTRTKHGANVVAKRLDQAGFASAAIHGNKSQAARQRALEAFRAGKLPVLVATDLAARGIDVDNVTHVVNFELPHEPETYVHRVGRTGRAGASGVAVSFCSAGERDFLRSIERLLATRLPSQGQETPSSHRDEPRKPAGDQPGRRFGQRKRSSSKQGNRQRTDNRPTAHRAEPAGRSSAPPQPRSARGSKARRGKRRSAYARA
jgi:ATP-dependent RNA helicase RhlE